MRRVAFLIDGFNVYHSAKQVQRDQGGGPVKWLDLHGLCSSYTTSRIYGKDAQVSVVLYFSAFAHFLAQTKPAVITRHRTYIAALHATGVRTIMGRFKYKEKWCPACRTKSPAHEEKETDVSIAVTLLELCVTGACDVAVLVTGDTDLVPAISAARRLAPGVEVWVLAPYKRSNHDLDNVADGVTKIKAKAYRRYQLPASLQGKDGTTIHKPATW